jgi:hypothetical protein
MRPGCKNLVDVAVRSDLDTGDGSNRTGSEADTGAKQHIETKDILKPSYYGCSRNDHQ